MYIYIYYIVICIHMYVYNTKSSHHQRDLERLFGCDSNIGQGTGKARSFPVHKTCWRMGFWATCNFHHGQKNKNKQNSYNFPFLRQELAWLLIFCLLFFRCCTILSKLLPKICLKVLASSQRCKLHQDTPTYSPNESWSFTPRALFGCLPEAGSWSNDRKIATSKGIASASEPNELEHKFSSAEPRFRGLLGEVSGDAPSCQKGFAIRNPAEFQEKFCRIFCDKQSRAEYTLYIYIYMCHSLFATSGPCPTNFRTNKYFHSRHRPAVGTVQGKGSTTPGQWAFGIGPGRLGTLLGDTSPIGKGFLEHHADWLIL